MEKLTIIIYALTLAVFILFHYIRVSSHYSVVTALSGLHDNYNAVQLSKWLLSILSIVVTAISWSALGVAISIIVLLAVNQVAGFIAYKLSIRNERSHLLEKADYRLFPETLPLNEKYSKAEKIAIDKVDKNIKDKDLTKIG